MRFSLALAVLLAACDPGVRLGEPCEFNSDCPADLVCGHGRCRIACRVSRDCGPGLRCVQTGTGTPVCTLDQDRSCTETAQCSGDLVCSAGECRTRCDLGCSAEGRCEDGTCVEPRSGEDAGTPPIDAPPPPPDGPPRDCGARLVCGDGVLQGCEGDQQAALMRAILGHESGEMALLAPATVEAITTPRTGTTTALPPQVAIAGTAVGGAPGLGLVAWIDGAAGETQRLGRMRRFPLDDLSASSDLVVPGDQITGARTLALAEHGISIAGFWVGDTPMPSPGTSAWVTHYAGDMLYVYPLTSGDPPSDGFPRSAIVGGDSAMLGTTFDLYMINREDPPSPPAGVTSERIFGAVDEDRSMSTYRVITTEAYSNAGFLETTGSPGPLMVTRDPVGSRLAVWQVRRSTPLVPGEDPADRPPIQQLDVPAAEIGGAPTIALASAAGTDHVVGFPTPAGDLRFVRVICPAMADCAPTEPFATEASFGSGPTSIVRLARVDSGYAYAALAETSEGTQLLHLAFMDEDGASIPAFDPGTGVAGDLIPAGEVEGGAIADLAIHAVRGPDAITILVAALIRDDVRHLDTVWIGGLRACETR